MGQRRRVNARDPAVQCKPAAPLANTSTAVYLLSNIPPPAAACILRAAFCVLHSAYCILHTVCCVLRAARIFFSSTCNNIKRAENAVVWGSIN